MRLSLKTTLSALAIGVAMASSPLLAQAQSEQAPTAGSAGKCANGAADCNGGASMNKTIPQGATGKSDRAPEGAAKNAAEGQRQKPVGETAQKPADNNNVAQEPKTSDQQNSAATEKGVNPTKKAGEQDKTNPAQDQATDQDTSKPATQDQAADRDKSKSATQDQAAEQPKDKTGRQSDQGQAQDQSKPDTDKTASVTNVTVEQKTEITNVIREEKVEPTTRIDFSVSVGVAVPKHVHLHRLPARIVKIVPAYEDYEYFVLEDGRIVIVDPSDLKIVVILTA